MKRFPILVLSWTILTLSTFATNVTIDPFEEDGTARIELKNGLASSVYRIDESSDLKEWWPIYAQYGANWNYLIDQTDTSENRYFFKITESSAPSIAPHETWKTTIAFPDDPFQKAFTIPVFFTDEPLSLIKFIILGDDLTTVYFQNSETYPYHYNFATDRIEQFSEISTADFNLKTLYNENLEAILGNVIFAPEYNEYGIQFIAQDTIPRESINYLYHLVDTSIIKPEGTKGFYTPSYQQSSLAQQEEQWLAAKNIDVSSISKWETGDSAYTNGWAVGKLVYIPGDEIEEAYENGSLSPYDILLTENLPAEVPYVQGIITLTPASDNSHVAILAEASGIPFGYVSDSDLKNKFIDLLGKEVVLQVSASTYLLSSPIDLRLFPTDLPSELRQEVISRKTLPELEIQSIERLEAYSRSVDTLTPVDIKHFGGKAANFGTLRRSIPDNSPQAIAFSFDLWLEFLDQEINGIPLKTRISTLLGDYTWPVDNLPQLKADLDSIRDLIKDESQFSTSQKNAIISALSPFDSDQKIRFRSSTNVEDSQNFVGAGLYDSYSGCLLDNLDADNIGPSLCDSSKENEQGVFRAIRKVYASFYNDNAFLERLRYGIDESKVGMALLVHHSFPDETERANGVARAVYTNLQNYRKLDIYLTTQVGANSVTNPDEGMIPEIIHAQVFTSRTYFYVNQRSNLIPLGENYILDWESDYQTLSALLVKALDEYLVNDPDREKMILDFEYKKIAPMENFIVKQIREIPQNESGAGLPWVLNSSRSNAYRVFQGEGSGDIFSIHRMKSLLNLSGKNKILDQAGLSSSLLSTVEWEHIDKNGQITLSNGAPETWNNASFESKDGYNSTTIASDSWSHPQREDQEAIITLSGHFNSLPKSNQNPLISTEDFSWYLNTKYETPVLAIDQLSVETFGTTLESNVQLEQVPNEEIPFNAIPREHQFKTKNNEISIDIKHWWPDGPGPVNGYTAPLLQWDRTIINGLTTEPITLTGYYSQTYKPEHHNFGEWFLFEPALEETLSPQQKAELESAQIRQILMYTGDLTKVWSIDSKGTITTH